MDLKLLTPSNFQSYGSMSLFSGKSVIVKSVMDHLSEDVNQPSAEEANITRTAIWVFSVMCVVNMVTKTTSFIGSNFANIFVDIVESIDTPYGEMRVVFKQYLPRSLKEIAKEYKENLYALLRLLV